MLACRCIDAIRNDTDDERFTTHIQTRHSAGVAVTYIG
jgi:hypothetical protein